MNSTQLKEFYNKYSLVMGIRYIEKREWGIVTQAFRLLLKRYLSKYSDKIPGLDRAVKPMTLKNVVILPYDVGGSDWQYQIEVAIHEAQHALQIREYVNKGGSVSNWYKEYFIDREFRALQEGGANATEAEVLYALKGIAPTPPDLSAYYVGTEGQKLSDKTYNIRVRRIRELGRGSSTTVVSSKAISILKDMEVL